MLKPTITVIAQSLLISPLVILQPGLSHAQQPSQTDALNQARAGIEQLSANHAQLSSENKNSHRQYNQQGFQMENITLNTEVGNLAANLYLLKGIITLNCNSRRAWWLIWAVYSSTHTQK